MTEGSRHRGWAFTDYRVGVTYDLGAQYVIVGTEVCPSTGREHQQGFAYWKNPVRISTVMKALPQCHIEMAKGTSAQNRDYCKKDGNFLEIGTFPQQGKRVDLDEVLKEIQARPDLSTVDMIEEFGGTWARNYRALDIVKSKYETKRDWVTEVVYLWGPSGSGKTKRAMDDGAVQVEFKSGFILNYNGEDVVVFDDIDEYYFFKHRSDVLKMLDRYACTVNIKGGNRNWKPKKIYLTSNYPPVETLCFGKKEIDGAIKRRITEVTHMNGTDVEAG